MKTVGRPRGQICAVPIRERAIGIMAALFTLSGCSGHPERAVSVTDSIVEANQCGRPPTTIVRAPDSLPSSTRCALVTAALRRLSSATTAELPQLLPTSAVEGAAIDLMSEFDSTGAGKGTWWVVTLYVPSAAMNVEVRFDLANGLAGVRPVHK